MLLYHYLIKDHGSWWSKHYEPLEDPDLFIVAMLIFGCVSFWELWCHENPNAEDHDEDEHSDCEGSEEYTIEE